MNRVEDSSKRVGVKRRGRPKIKHLPPSSGTIQLNRLMPPLHTKVDVDNSYRPYEVVLADSKTGLVYLEVQYGRDMEEATLYAMRRVDPSRKDMKEMIERGVEPVMSFLSPSVRRLKGGVFPSSLTRHYLAGMVFDGFCVVEDHKLQYTVIEDKE